MKKCDCIKDLNVLVAEDSEFMCLIISEFLKESGANYDIAHDGAELLELFHNNCCCYYDLIITDNQMPRLLGINAVSEIRQIDRGDGKLIPIIMLTSDEISTLQEQVKSSGIDVILQKPYKFDELCNEIENLIRKRKAVYKTN